jgi:tricorn protease
VSLTASFGTILYRKYKSATQRKLNPYSSAWFKNIVLYLLTIPLLSRIPKRYYVQTADSPFSIPNAVVNGPKIMLTNSHALSGGDLMPYMFRAKGVGKLVGTTTFGILVGNAGNPGLMDGAYIEAPNIGIFSTEEKWIIEQEGVAPDIDVENYPKDLLNGHDAQLEKAIELILKDLKPHKELKQPADPIRVADY